MMSHVRNLKEAIMPIIWLNCIFCMGIFEIPTNRPRYYLSIFYVISTMTGYFIMLYKGINIFLQTFTYEHVLHHFVLWINVLVAILAIILFWWKSENVNSIIKRSSMADNTLEELGIKIDYQKIFSKILFFTALWIVGIISLCILYMMWIYRDTGYWIALHRCVCVCFPVTINSVVDLTFTSFIRCIQTKYQNTNILINNVVLCANESSAFKIRNRHEKISITFVKVNYKIHKDKIIHLIRTLRHLHLEITRLARQVNHTYCLQLLLELAVHFTVVTSSIYSLFDISAGHFHVIFNNEKIIAIAMWAAIYSIKIILVNWMCTNVSTEAYKTGEIIQSFEGSIIDNDMREEIHQFTQQIVLNSLSFTAFGFFSINNSLTGKFFATVTTFVVILIQMNTTIRSVR